MIDYLNAHYLTIEQIADKTGISIKNIENLIKNHCIPKHSHRVICQTVFETVVFGSTMAAEAEIFYYHPSLINFIIEAENYRKNTNFDEAAKKMKSDFMQALHSELIKSDIKKTIENSDIEEYLLKTWGYVMDGTYGVCLKEISVKNIVIKAISVAKLQKWIDSDKPKLNEEQYNELLEAAKNYDQVASSFGPHEISKSTRGRLFDVFMKTHNITDT